MIGWLACGLFGIGLVGNAFAQDIHKCRAADGSVSYQDTPCAGESLPVPPISGPPSEPFVPAPADPDHTPGAEAGGSTPVVAQPASLPALYRCTRENGERYVSSDPSPPARYVPAWVLGATTSNSNLPRTPAKEAWDRSIGGAYVLVRDVCRPMPRAELCLHWKQRLDEVRRAVRASFFDERVALEQESAGLREYLRQHCGR